MHCIEDPNVQEGGRVYVCGYKVGGSGGSSYNNNVGGNQNNAQPELIIKTIPFNRYEE
jgi:hypothetical protein